MRSRASLLASTSNVAAAMYEPEVGMVVCDDCEDPLAPAASASPAGQSLCRQDFADDCQGDNEPARLNVTL
jgi:hypothetical protein